MIAQIMFRCFECCRSEPFGYSFNAGVVGSKKQMEIIFETEVESPRLTGLKDSAVYNVQI